MTPMQRQFYEMRGHTGTTGRIWAQITTDVVAQLRPLAERCIERRLRPTQAEREIAAVEERLRGLAEACAYQLFMAGVRFEELDPEEAFTTEALADLRPGLAVHFCSLVACCHLLTAFGLVRSNCAMPEVWPAMMMRALSEGLPEDSVEDEQRLPQATFPSRSTRD